MVLKDIFNLPKLIMKYEQSWGSNTNSDKSTQVSSISAEDKFSMLLKYEDGNPELIPYKLYKRQVLMYGNNYHTFMKKAMNLQKEIIYSDLNNIPKEQKATTNAKKESENKEEDKKTANKEPLDVK